MKKNYGIFVLLSVAMGLTACDDGSIPRKEHTATHTGFVVFKDNLVICGTAIPTKEIGPASAVTQADKRLDSKMIQTLKKRI